MLSCFLCFLCCFREDCQMPSEESGRVRAPLIACFLYLAVLPWTEIPLFARNRACQISDLSLFQFHACIVLLCLSYMYVSSLSLSHMHVLSFSLSRLIISFVSGNCWRNHWAAPDEMMDLFRRRSVCGVGSCPFSHTRFSYCICFDAVLNESSKMWVLLLCL